MGENAHETSLFLRLPLPGTQRGSQHPLVTGEGGRRPSSLMVATQFSSRACGRGSRSCPELEHLVSTNRWQSEDQMLETARHEALRRILLWAEADHRQLQQLELTAGPHAEGA